ncbi:inositol monophosphatase family protein [Luedemannella helvata]|uniref:inositol-phosphate phosphatase n=1 Tax=Luedemannella helvata TaxID=349315 RepID=A0ABP4X7G1_9ACTN
MLDERGVAEVERIVRSVAADEIMPRFRRLAATDIIEKTGPDNLVTVADRAAEAALAAQLATLVPGSVTVGEEAVAEDPTLLDTLTGDAPVWIVDPIDGTHNFATDNPRFTVLVALSHRGRLLASWTYAPAFDMLATAVAGGGATLDGRPLRVGPAATDLRHLDVGTPQQRWWTSSDRARFNTLCGYGVALSFFDTTGLEYVQLAAGRRTSIVVTWDHPWDHAAGVLLVTEAGGVATAADGSPYRPAAGNALPMVVAPDAACAARLHAAMLAPAG